MLSITEENYTQKTDHTIHNKFESPSQFMKIHQREILRPKKKRKAKRGVQPILVVQLFTGDPPLVVRHPNFPFSVLVLASGDGRLLVVKERKEREVRTGYLTQTQPPLSAKLPCCSM